MTHRLRWVVGFSALYLVSLLVAAPASHVLALLAHRLQPVSFSATRGTVFLGSANVSLGDTDVGDLSWRASLGGLTTGCLAYAVAWRGSPRRSGAGDGVLSACIDGSVFLPRAELHLDAGRIAPWIQVSALSPRGAITLSLAALRYLDVNQGCDHWSPRRP